MRIRHFLCACFAASSACAYVPQAEPHRPDVFDRIQEQHDAYAAEFSRDQDRLQAGYTGPKRYDFKGNGSIVVANYVLEGLPHEEHLRVSFTYENTTKQTFDGVRVWLTIKDAAGEPVASQRLDLSPPFGLRMPPGVSYTDEIAVLTHGAHREPGWTWEIGCSAMRAVAPTERPKPGRR